MMLNLDPKLKKKKGAEYFQLDEDLDDEWIKQHQDFLVEEQKQKIEKRFEKENEKRRAEGEKELKAKDLEERMDAVKELREKFKKENKTKKVEPEGRGPTVEKFENSLEKLDKRIETMTVQAEDKENNKEVALGTSKIVSVQNLLNPLVAEIANATELQNYIDPRLTVVFSKKFNVPIEKFFSKALREKFEWAIKSVDEDWEF